MKDDRSNTAQASRTDFVADLHLDAALSDKDQIPPSEVQNRRLNTIASPFKDRSLCVSPRPRVFRRGSSSFRRASTVFGRPPGRIGRTWRWEPRRCSSQSSNSAKESSGSNSRVTPLPPERRRAGVPVLRTRVLAVLATIQRHLDRPQASPMEWSPRGDGDRDWIEPLLAYRDAGRSVSPRHHFPSFDSL